jgi:hypothetical protein
LWVNNPSLKKPLLIKRRNFSTTRTKAVPPTVTTAAIAAVTTTTAAPNTVAVLAALILGTCTVLYDTLYNYTITETATIDPVKIQTLAQEIITSSQQLYQLLPPHVPFNEIASLESNLSLTNSCVAAQFKVYDLLESRADILVFPNGRAIVDEFSEEYLMTVYQLKQGVRFMQHSMRGGQSSMINSLLAEFEMDL